MLLEDNIYYYIKRGLAIQVANFSLQVHYRTWWRDSPPFPGYAEVEGIQTLNHPNKILFAAKVAIFILQIAHLL